MRRLILGMILFAGCWKKEDSSTSITVLESVTNLPVSSAYVYLYGCANSCNVPGYNKLLSVGYTDANGICEVPTHSFEHGNSMRVDMGGYWLFQRQYTTTTVYMDPIGWIQLRLHKIGNYPAGSSLSLTIISESGRRVPINIIETFPLAFGGQKNKIEWQVLDAVGSIASGTMDGLQVPRLDTLKNVTLSY